MRTSKDTAMLSCSPEDASRGWLISTSTVVVSKMTLDKSPLLDLSPFSDITFGTSKKRDQVTACQNSSKQLQSRLSISSNMSVPGLVEDNLGCSDSDTSFEDYDYHSTANELWDSFWTADSNPSLLTNTPRLQTFTFPGDLHRSGAVHHSTRTGQHYSPFPVTSPPRLPKSPSGHIPHKSWPLRVESMDHAPLPRPAVRHRAYTTPSPFKTHVPSNLSTCTTAAQTPSESITPSDSIPCTPPTKLLMSSSPQHQHSPLPLMELMHMEKSVFEDYDDQEKSGLSVLAERLHLRRGSADAGMESPERAPKRQRKSLKRSASDAIKGVFGMKN